MKMTVRTLTVVRVFVFQLSVFPNHQQFIDDLLMICCLITLNLTLLKNTYESIVYENSLFCALGLAQQRRDERV